jgi:uncharacterized membrane protein YeiH
MNNNSKLIIIIAVIVMITLFVMFDKVKLSFANFDLDNVGFLLLTVLGYNAGSKYGAKKAEVKNNGNNR